MAERSALLANLSRLLGPRGMLTGEEISQRSCDPFGHIPPLSAAILRPASTQQLAAMMRLCHAAGQPVVMHGGRTGVAGGAVAGKDELVVSLERMNAIVEVDTVGHTMTVEAGATIAAVQDAATEAKLFYPIDLGSKGTATVGGTIATNAGGNRVIRWGMTRQNILGIEAVLADGTIVTALNQFLKNNSGYDLKQLFIGSEGTFGIVAKAVLRLVPKPSSQNVALLSLASYEQVLDLLTRARAMQQLSAFEVMWQDYYAIVAGHSSSRQLVEPAAAFYVLIEFMGNDASRDEAAFEALLEDAFSADLLVDAVIARSGKQIDEIWSVREGSAILVREMGPFISFDISVDIRRADEFVGAVRTALANQFGDYRSVAFGHLGDSNIHIGAHVGPDTVARGHEVEACVYRVVADFGGALTAEHGIGTFKRGFLPDHVTADALATMKKLRRAFDERGVLNRNVLFDEWR